MTRRSNTICFWNSAHDSPHAYVLDGDILFGPAGHKQATGHSCQGQDPLEAAKRMWNGWEVDYCERDAGNYYPRMFRDGYRTPVVVPMSDDEETAFAASTEQEYLLEADLSSIARVVTPSPTNLGAYGSQIRNLLILACTEVEAQWKGILRTNGYAQQVLTTKDYVKLLGPLRLDAYSLRMFRYRDNAEISPFANWDATNPTQSLPWYAAYNAAKHDREISASQATLAHAISAVAAVCTLLAAQYGNRYVRPAERPFFGITRLPHWHARERTYSPAKFSDWKCIQYAF